MSTAAGSTRGGVVAFPAQVNAAQSLDASPAGTVVAIGPGGGGRGRVLIVDAEYGLPEVLALHLSAAGYEPAVVTDGLTALYEVESTRPDVVLLDLHLPQVSGFRLIHLLKHRTGSTPPRVIVMTALSFQEAADALQSGTDDFIHKPFLPAEIVTRVDQVLARVV
jgi:DNA-binding response OmpR family regulator